MVYDNVNFEVGVIEIVVVFKNVVEMGYGLEFCGGSDEIGDFEVEVGYGRYFVWVGE